MKGPEENPIKEPGEGSVDHHDDTAEISALRKARDFPAPDAERDARIRDAMGAALAAQKATPSRGARRIGHAPFIIGLAAAVIVGALCVFQLLPRRDSEYARGPTVAQKPAEMGDEMAADGEGSRRARGPKSQERPAAPEFKVIEQEVGYAETKRTLGSSHRVTRPKLPPEVPPGVSVAWETEEDGEPVADDTGRPAPVPGGLIRGDASPLGPGAGGGGGGGAGDNVRVSGTASGTFGTGLISGGPPSPLEKAEAGHGATTRPEVKTWKRAEIVPNTSRLMIGDKEELPLKGMQANVQVDGFRARVLLDCYFFNDRGRQFEGTFQLRLPNEASPYFLAFGETTFKAPEIAADQPLFYSVRESREISFKPADIMLHRAATWSKPKEARMVPREKAALAYTETVRRRVDPALMEWSGAGIFSARVFPLAPKRLHRIIIGYDVDLLRAGDNLEYRLDLPAGIPECVVDLDIADLPGASVEVTPKAKPFKEKDRIHYRFDNPDERTVNVRIENTGPIILAGTDEKTGPYFAARFRPELPGATASAGLPRAIFLVDVSLSSNPERFNVWLKLLRAILDKNRDSLKEFAVLFFNVEAFWWREGFTDNTPDNVKALLDFAGGLSLEGATDIGTALARAQAPSWIPSGSPSNWDVFLLSDGAATWGERNLHALSSRLKSGLEGALFAYTTGFSGTDVSALGHLARETGGAVFSVIGEAEIERASTAHRVRPWRLTGVRMKGTSDLILAGRPQSIYPGQELFLVGRGTPDAGAEVVLRLRGPDDTKAVKTKLAHLLRSDLAPRAYGQVAVGELEALEAATEDVSKAYATHFRVTGRTCSLLMLESEEDYRRYDIKPEEDAFVVKTSLASAVVAKSLKTIKDTLGDPKAAFLAWLERMEEMPGLSFKVPTALLLALDSMPSSAFAVVPPPLACKLRTWDGIPGNLQEQLAARNLDYDAVTAEALRRRKDLGPGDALRALSSLIENRPGDAPLARDVGFSAMEWELGGQAYHLFRRVAVQRPYEPETYRAMALCLEDMGLADLALAYFEVGLSGKWNDRFGDFRRILGFEYLRFLRRMDNGELETSVPEFARARLESIAGEFGLAEADIMVTITWSTDSTDVDLHVLEPTGEECFYKHRVTRIGGHLTRDVTQGYGPEMYTLQKAPEGTYGIKVKYFSSDRNRASTRTKVYATIFEGWGTKHEKVTRKVVTLVEGREMHDIGTVTIGK